MNQNMNNNKFFTVEPDKSSDQALKILPTVYLEELHPYQAMEEIEDYIETLETAMENYHGEKPSIRTDLGRIGSLAFELELVRTFLASFRQVYGTMH